MTWPSSKWWASAIVSTLTLIAVMINAAMSEGIELPEWLVLVGSIIGPVLMYLKPENRPSPSAREKISQG